MPTYSTNAIIIGRHNFGEADRILVLLTPERGVVRAVSKGVRRIKSRLAGHLELFSESELMLAKGKNMDIVTAARLHHHLAVGDDYDRMRLAYLFAEMVNRLGAENEHQEGMFELVHQAYQALAAGETSVALELWFKLRLLDLLGYRPELGGCVNCGTSDSAREYTFNIELGGIVDLGCSIPGRDPMTHTQIKLWRVMMKRSYNAIALVDAVATEAVATLPICNRFYDYTFGKRFKSSETLS